MCSKPKKCQNMIKDPFFLVIHFVNLRLSFNLISNLEVRVYCHSCEGQN